MLNDELAARLGRGTIKRLLKVDRTVGRFLLKAEYPDLTLDEIQEALGLCASTALDYAVDLPRNKFYAVAWLVGVSWGQLADLYQVSRSTIQSGVRQLIPSQQRAAIRLFNGKLSLEQVSLVKAEYDRLVETDIELVRSSSPLVIAKIIHTVIEEESDKI